MRKIGVISLSNLFLFSVFLRDVIGRRVALVDSVPFDVLRST